jgi:23S rRNA (pseudouridine1915-N3)-methyltransferase
VKIRLLCVGTRMPGWVQDGFADYARRLPKDNALTLEEIAVADRRGHDVDRWRTDEGKRLLARIGRDERVVTLDARGRSLSSERLAATLADWRSDGRNVALLVGGPDGLDDACRTRAEWSWSLSEATFPHGLVRVIVAEQIYRAWTVLTGHPYHRA